MGGKYLDKNVYFVSNCHLPYRNSKRHFMKKFGHNPITTITKIKICIPYLIQITVPLALLSPCYRKILKVIAIPCQLLKITAQNVPPLRGLIQSLIQKNLVVYPSPKNIFRRLLKTTMYYPTPIIFQIHM